MASVTLTISVSEELKRQLDRLAVATDRSQTWLAQQALSDFVTREAWQVAEIEAGLTEAEAGDFASPDAVAQVFAKWRESLPPPKSGSDSGSEGSG